MFDRFKMPDDVYRVTGGPGGESNLIVSSKYSCVIDTGMAFCGDVLVKNIEKHLGDRDLDYIFLSHTHYDHLGAVLVLKRRWPEAKVVCHPYGNRVISSDGAKYVMKDLSIKAALEYDPSKEDFVRGIDWNELNIDIIVEDGQVFDFFDFNIRAIYTPGHTNCCVSFYIEEKDLLFPSESTGCYSEELFHMVILKSYRDTLASIEAMRKIGSKNIVSPHFGILPPEISSNYWELCEKEARRWYRFALSRYFCGFTIDEIFEDHKNFFWLGSDINGQPFDAFKINSYAIIKAMLKDILLAL